ncbi:hypothetical protein SAY86_013523 [Trapa natans]|uniref:Uncharacterized protein n=1 Tax=Trapa natans TaxID=22666 RepID=A0AAN7KLW8_TRANT|nr:hypothetical protein SAY86_013523 [Trapa natans]
MEESSFVHALPNPNVELYFTLDEYINLRGSLNFFYKDYPRVVSFPTDGSSNKRTSTLPGVGIIRESDLRRLVFVNSPRIGIVIDVAMTYHITMLLSLCLKAIAKESLGLVKSRKSKFNCPILVQATTWLASQLFILYGEMSRKSSCYSTHGEVDRHGKELGDKSDVDDGSEMQVTIGKGSRRINDAREGTSWRRRA